MSIQNPSHDDIQAILNTKKRIAVVGLSDNPERASYQVSKYMQENGYEIIPVNPTISETLGEKAYSSLAEIDGHVDIVNVFRRSEYLPEVAKDTVKIGADVFWAQLGLENHEAYQYLKEKGVTTVMNKCILVEYRNR
jgi:predicted CoA-binding protein